MTLEGSKLIGILRDIQESKEVSMYYKRYLLREGYITREQKPITGRGRPGFRYVLTQKGNDAVHSI